MEWDTVIGLEVHAQLNTQSKLFSNSTCRFGDEPNAHASFIDAALPGTLPVLNEEVVRMGIQFGLAVNADINDLSVFERKHYFYPDLPKGYQISQFQNPLITNGSLVIRLKNGQEKIVIIERAHIEEDAGKSIHAKHSNFSGIDLNRAGTPLLEIVTTPCLFSVEEAICYLKTLHQLLRFLGICTGNMQEGAFRCDVNMSLKPKGENGLGTRVELKNLNSFRNIEKAILYEQDRQQAQLEQNLPVYQETRLYHADSNTTEVMRSKEQATDYRYFPDPDLLPIRITRYQIAEIKSRLPALPQALYETLKTIQNIKEEEIQFLLSAPEIYHYYMTVKRLCKASEKLIINWLKEYYAAALKDTEQGFSSPPIPAHTLAQLLDALEGKRITLHQARGIFNQLWQDPKATTVEKLIEDLGEQPSFSEKSIQDISQKLLQEHPALVAEYQAGKEKVLAFFVGQLLKQAKGLAPETARNILLNQLKK